MVTVAGPRADMVTRRKERRFGIWINTDSRQFLKVPTYLALFSNRPFDAIASPEVQRRQQLGLNNVLLTQRVGPDYADVVPDDAFRSAFVRLRKQHGLYREETSAVTFLTPTLFRTSIPLPAEVPIGTYNVEIKLFADGALVTKTDTAFEIVKVGFEQFVATTARQNGFVYGLVTAFMALMTRLDGVDRVPEGLSLTAIVRSGMVRSDTSERIAHGQSFADRDCGSSLTLAPHPVHDLRQKIPRPSPRR